MREDGCRVGEGECGGAIVLYPTKISLCCFYLGPHGLNQDFNGAEVFESLIEEDNRAKEAENISEWEKREACHKKKRNEARSMCYEA